MRGVTTIKGGEQYRAPVMGRNGDPVNVTFCLTERDGNPMVWLYTAKSSIGLYRMERFGGNLSPSSVRSFIDQHWTAG